MTRAAENVVELRAAMGFVAGYFSINYYVTKRFTCIFVILKSVESSDDRNQSFAPSLQLCTILFVVHRLK